MNEFVIRKDSWHYRFLKWYRTTLNAFDIFKGRPEEYERYYLNPTDFCAYWRSVLLWPLVRFSVNAVFLVLIGICLASSFAYGVPGLYLFIAVGAVVVFMFLVTFAANFLVNTVGVADLLANKIDEISSSKIATTIHKAYKEKFCPYIVYEKKDT